MTTDDARVAAVSAYEDAEPYKKLIEQLRSPHFGTVFGNEAADVIEALLSRKQLGGDDPVMARLQALSVGDEFTAEWVVDGCRSLAKKQVYNVLTYQTKIGVLERIAYGRYRIMSALSTETPPVAPAQGVTDDFNARLTLLEQWAHEPFDFTDLITRLEALEAALAVPARGVEMEYAYVDGPTTRVRFPLGRRPAPDAPKSELERLRIVANCYTDSVMRHSAYGFSASDPDGDYTYFDQAQSLLDAERAEREKAERERDDLEKASKGWWGAWQSCAEAAEAKLAEAVKERDSALESRQFWFDAAGRENERAETIKAELSEAELRGLERAESICRLYNRQPYSIHGAITAALDDARRTFLQSQDKEADHVDPR